MANKYTVVLNPDGINTGNVLEGTSCPIHASQLKFLYEEKLYSFEKIAMHIKEVTGRVTNQGMCRSWCQKIGIVFRSRSQALSILHKHNPYLLGQARALIQNRYRFSSDIANSWQKKAIRNAKKSKIAQRIQLTCSNIHCACGDNWSRKKFTRSKSRVSPLANYCCSECRKIAMPGFFKDLKRQKKLRDITPAHNSYTVPEHMRELANYLGVEV